MRKNIFLLAFVFLTASCNNKPQSDVTAAFEPNEDILTQGVSFQVDDVEPADSLLKTDKARLVFENKLHKQISFFPEEFEHMEVVAFANNGLIQTVQECYDNHRPLVLTPDVIWLAICQGVSIHINEHYDSLKDIIFVKDKPSQIVVRNDSLGKGAKHWSKLINDFTQDTKQYTKDDFYSFFVPAFSTTTTIEKTAYQVTLLESFKKAFDYVAETGCGIPSIRVTGTEKDWQAILKKLDMLNQIGLGAWGNNLKPIVEEFVKVAADKPDPIFWKSIYKDASEYARFSISGWIIKFFPYIKELEEGGVYDAKREELRTGEILKPNPFFEGDDYLKSTLSTDNFPTGIAKVPVTWINHFTNETTRMEVFAGFFAIRQYEDGSLKPLISWAICEKDAKPVVHKLAVNEDLALKHQNDYWSPNFALEVTDSAIYDVSKLKTAFNSGVYLKCVLLEALLEEKVFPQESFLDDTVSIEVYSNGTVGKVRLLKSGNVQMEDYLTSFLKRLPKPWFPALAHPTDVLDLMDFPEEQDKVKIRVNSIVKVWLHQ